MRPIAEAALIIGYHSRIGKAIETSSEFCGVTSFVLYQKESNLRVTLGIVADGIGDDAYGEEASQLAVQIVRRYFTQSESPDILSTLYQALSKANRLLYERGLTYSELGGRLGTTLAAAVVVDNKLYIANIGNSRIYVSRPGHKFTQISIDHTRPPASSSPADTDEFARPAADHLERYLGQMDEANIDFRLWLRDGQSSREMLGNQGIKLQPGDTILLATDGVTHALTDEKTKAVLEKYPPDKAAERLTKLALGRNGRQSASALVMQIPGGAAKPSPHSLRPLWLYGGLGLAGLLLIAALVFGATLVGSWFGNETPEPAATVTIAPSPKATQSNLLLPTIIPSNTPTSTPTQTPTETPTSTPTNTPTPTFTPRPTWTPRPRPTWTPSPRPVLPTATQTPTPESTELPTETPTLTEATPETTKPPQEPTKPPQEPTKPPPEPTETPIPRP